MAVYLRPTIYRHLTLGVEDRGQCFGGSIWTAPPLSCFVRGDAVTCGPREPEQCSGNCLLALQNALLICGAGRGFGGEKKSSSCDNSGGSGV